ncbi:MAG: hypothetical protein KDC46_02065 [Thermoleophilia bacterium]|nr:hypothetical protein [Thermoleophilia bacterium]
MRIAPHAAIAAAAAPKPAKDAPVINEPGDRYAWTNPAAAAALRSTAELLSSIEQGIIRNISNVNMVRGYAADLGSTMDIFETATQAISSDAYKENDSFLPLITTAGGGVTHAQERLVSKELNSTWPIERGDILASIRRARAISSNVADQLDPRSTRPSSTL